MKNAERVILAVRKLGPFFAYAELVLYFLGICVGAVGLLFGLRPLGLEQVLISISLIVACGFGFRRGLKSLRSVG